jgi:hypothetical protein
MNMQQTSQIISIYAKLWVDLYFNEIIYIKYTIAIMPIGMAQADANIHIMHTKIITTAMVLSPNRAVLALSSGDKCSIVTTPPVCVLRLNDSSCASAASAIRLVLARLVHVGQDVMPLGTCVPQ